MEKDSNGKTAQSKKALQQSDLKNSSKNIDKKSTSVGPEEFEEDQAMNIRMKPQPLNQQGSSKQKKPKAKTKNRQK